LDSYYCFEYLATQVEIKYYLFW